MATEPMFYVGTDEVPDKYRLKRQVGSGGEAQLWEAQLDVEGTWEPVALKILRPDHFADLDRWKDRWSAQAEVLRFIRHPGVVGVREHFEGGGMHYAGEAPPGPRALYLVMNWHVGETLRDWSQQHRSAADSYEALRYLAQVGDVLDWLHSGQATPSGRPVIHADVTANNVLVTPLGQAVLVDFGLVRLAAGLSPVAEGTAGYLAPEVLALGAYSPASDRYAFGALTYFVLTGAPAPTTLPEIRAGLAQAPAVIGQPAVLEHLMQMFTPEPAGRPACGEWIRYFRVTGATSADLSGATYTRPVEPGMAPPPTMPMAASPPTTVMPVTPPPAAPSSVAPAPARPPARKKRKLLWVAVAIIGVLLGAGIAYAATRNAGSSSTATTLPTTSAVPDSKATTTSSPATTTTTTAVPPTTTTVPSTSAPSTVAPTTVAPRGSTSLATTPTTGSATPTSPGRPLSGVVDLLADNTNFVVSPTIEPPFAMSRGKANINGRNYEHALAGMSVPCSFGRCGGNLTKGVAAATDFNLSRSYARFHARIGITDESAAGPATTVKVLLDGVEKNDDEFRTSTIQLGQSFDLDLNVTNVLRVHIEFVGLGLDNNPNAFVVPAIGGVTAQ